MNLINDIDNNTDIKISDVKINDITDFFLELDALKRVERRSYVTQTNRRENSAEHSWHLAMACWSIAEQFDIGVNLERLLKMALVHDLGEIDAGDTFLYSDKRNDAHVTEREGIKRLATHRGNGISDLSLVWEAQETGNSKETQLIKVVDRLLPLLLNLNTEGKTWSEMSVKRHQVEQAHAFIADIFPIIHIWIAEQIDYATKQGWLIDE